MGKPAASIPRLDILIPHGSNADDEHCKGTFHTAVNELIRQFNVNIQEIDSSAPAGAYTIHTRDDFDVGDTRVLIGLGKKDQHNRSIPVASVWRIIL